MTDNIRALYWGLLSAGLFSIVSAMAKIAVLEYHVLQILFFRQMVLLISSLPQISKDFPNSLKTQHLGWHMVRLTGAFVALSCGIWAVAVLPLTTATTLAFSQSFFVLFLAIIILGEAKSKARIMAIIAGFIGVIIVMQPTPSEIINENAMIAIIGAIGAAFAVISVRKLSQTESTATLLIYQALFVGLLAFIPMFWLWKTPDLWGWIFLISMGVLSTIGQWIGVKSLRLGEASFVSNVEYSKLLYAIILGVILFSEWIDLYTAIGAAIIIASSALIVRHEAKK